jgi:branched-chain amino acid transport system permease protein
MIGAYVVFVLVVVIGLSYIPGLILAIVVMAAVGILFERTIIRPSTKTGRWVTPLITTLGVAMILEMGAIVVWTSMPKEVPVSYALIALDVLGIRFTVQRIIILVAVVLSFLALHLFTQRTKFGKAMRGLSDNEDACRLVGVNVYRIYSLAFALGYALVGLAGGLSAPMFSVYPTMGLPMGLKSFSIVIAGGFGDVRGTIVAAFLLGITESLFAGLVSYQWKEAVAFIFLLVVALFKPEGLFGKAVRF